MGLALINGGLQHSHTIAQEVNMSGRGWEDMATCNMCGIERWAWQLLINGGLQHSHTTTQEVNMSRRGWEDTATTCVG